MNNEDYAALSKRFHRGLEQMEDEDLRFMSEPIIRGTRILAPYDGHVSPEPPERVKLVATLLEMQDCLAKEIPAIIDRLKPSDAEEGSGLCERLGEFASSFIADSPIGNRDSVQAQLDELLRIVAVLAKEIFNRHYQEYWTEPEGKTA